MAFLDKTGLERLWLHILSKTNQTLASAKQYADDIKNDLLNGAGGAYDTLKELGDLIDENADAIDAIEKLADTKSDKGHIHDDRYYTEAEVDDALKFVKEASGEIIAVNDSAEQNLVGLKLYGKTTQATTTGKNLLDIASIVPPSATYNGITITSLGNGFTVKGTATGNAAFKWALTTPIPAGTYWLHAWNVGFNAVCTLYFEKPGTVDVGHTALSSNYRKQKIASDGDLVYLKLYIPSGQTVDMHLCPMLTVEETDTYEPYTGGIPSPNPNYPQPLVNTGDGGSISVHTYGKNLIRNTLTTLTTNGITFTKLNDGGIKVTGTSTAIAYYNMDFVNKTLITGQTYTASINEPSNVHLYVGYYTGNNLSTDFDLMGVVHNDPVTFVVPETYIGNRFYLRVESGKTVDTIIYPQIEIGSVATAFEPYKDGGSLTAQTPNGLPGIKVSSGGNYVDTQGQMWICDKIDCERGVYVKRIGQDVLTGSEYIRTSTQQDGVNTRIEILLYGADEATKYDSEVVTHSTHFKGSKTSWVTMPVNSVQYYLTIGAYVLAGTVSVEAARAFFAEQYNNGTPVITHYILATPIETPLSAAELAAFRAMMSQKPVTTIYNDAGAGMIVEYADIKIDDIEKALNLPEIDSTLTLSNAAAEAKATGTALAGKVDKVAGKGLSTNDFTTAEKEKLSRLSETGNIEVDSELSDNSENPVQNKVINDALKFLKKSNGSIINITDGAAHPAIELISHIEPLQEGSGDPSPDNVRPINGWDAVDITRTGKNLFGGDALADKLVSVINGIKDTAAETITFYAPNATGQKLLTGIFKPNTQYTFVFYGRNDAPDSPLNLRIVYSDGTNTTPVFSERNKDEQIVIYSEYGKTIEDIRCVYWDGSTTLYYNKCGVFEGVVEAAQFEPYNGTTLTATLPQTIYGGEMDWNTGVLNDEYILLNLNGEEFWEQFGTTIITAFPNSRNKPILDLNERKNSRCSHYKYNYGSGENTFDIYTQANSWQIRFRPNMNVDNWKTYLATQAAAGTPIQIAYPIETPTTYQLTPQQLETLKGVNNAWSDCGETELTYADIKIDEIEKILIDPTLSIKGTAAEAQVVGKELQHLQKETQFLDEAKGNIITVNNSAELPLNNLKLYGKTTQATTTGKNILPGGGEERTGDFILYPVAEVFEGSEGKTVVVSFDLYSPDGSAVSIYAYQQSGLSISNGYDFMPGANAYVRYSFATTIFKYEQTLNTGNVIFYSPSGAALKVKNVQIEFGSTATSYEPYTGGIPSPNPDYPQELVSVGDDGSIGVKTMGKNLLPINSINTNQNDAGVIELTYLPAGTYTLSADITKYADDTATNTRMTCSIIYTDGQTEGFSTDFDVNKAENDGITRRKQRSFLIRADKKVQRIVIYALDYSVPGSGRNAKAENIQIEYGPTATAFEPYKDGGTLAISTPNGLPGIPVSSDGNYIDTTGQMWVCDEKDYGRGVYVQRVVKLTIDGSADELIRKNTTDSNDWLHYIELPYAKQNFSRGYCDKLQEQGIYMLQQYGGIGYLLNTEYDVCYINMSSYMEDNSVAALRNVLAANPITIIYILKTPIETPLSESELAAYRAMSTQYPTTTIYNDAAADMYVSYGTYKAGEMYEALGLDETTSLDYLPITGGVITGEGTVKLIPQRSNMEGGEIALGAPSGSPALNSIILDNYNGEFRVFGYPSADGTTKTGTGTPLVVDPYDKTVSGAGGTYTFNGIATSANKLNTNAGAATQPVYFVNGVPTATTHVLEKSVPSDAVFTDTQVTQTATATSNYRPLIMGNHSSADTSTLQQTTCGVVTVNNNLYAQASTGSLYANKYVVNSAVTMEYDATNECLNFVFK